MVDAGVVRLIEIICSVLNVSVESIDDLSMLKDIDTWDSLRHMELIVSIESEFNIELTYEDIVNMKSVGDIKKTILKSIKQDEL